MLKEVKRVFKDTVVYGLGSLLPKAAGIILVPIYTRYLAPADYGLISLAGMVTTMVSSVMLLGQNGSLALYLRQLENEGDEGSSGTLIFSVAAFVLVVDAFLLAVLLGIGPIVTPLVVNQPRFTFNPYMILALTTAFLTLPFGLIQAVNRSRGQSVVHTALQLSSFTLNTGITIIFVVALRQGAAGSLKGTLGAALILAPVSLYFLARNMRFEFSWSWLKKSLAFGLPFVPHFFAGWMLTFSDRWILSQYRTLDEVGLYALAYNVGMVLNIVVTAVNMAWGPVYYDLAATEQGRAKLPRLITVYAGVVTAFAMAYLLFSRELLQLLATERFLESADIVPIIVAGYFAFAMYSVLSTGIFYAKKTKLIPLISAFAAAVNIGLNIIFVPKYGMWSAAWMTLVAYAVMAIAGRYFSGRYMPGSFEDSRLVKLVALFFLVFVSNWGVNSLGLVLVANIAAKAGVFAVALVLFVAWDIVALSELRSLLRRFKSGRRGPRPPAQPDEIQAEEEGVDHGASDETGFGRGT